MTISSAFNDEPTLARQLLIIPFLDDFKTFCIFIASTTQISVPGKTWSPSYEKIVGGEKFDECAHDNIAS